MLIEDWSGYCDEDIGCSAGTPECGGRKQKTGGGEAAAVDGNSKTKSKNTEDSEKGVQEKKEQKQGKAATNKLKDRVLLFGDSLVRHVGRNFGAAACET